LYGRAGFGPATSQLGQLLKERQSYRRTHSMEWRQQPPH